MENDPRAEIIKSSGEVIRIHFICFTCKKVTVFTNDFVETEYIYKIMQCSHCLDTRFYIRGFFEKKG